MLFSISAAVLHGVAYAIYLFQIYGGGSVPNPASWSVWALLAVLNALTFWRASKDPILAAQFFTGTVMCFLVWVYSLVAGKFSPIDSLGKFILFFCVVACAVWWITKSAAYANIIICGIMLVSAFPTIQGVLENGKLERALPWYMWTAAFIITMLNVIKRKDSANPHWWFLLVTPVVCIFIHGIVAVTAKN